MMNKDEYWMRRCLALAVRGRGSVQPNPMVGAVIVHRGKKIAEGQSEVVIKDKKVIEAYLGKEYQTLKQNKGGENGTNRE